MEYISMEIEQLMTLLKARHSCRAYIKDRTVDDSIILKCIEAARLAPSACNKQPWHFIIVKNEESRKRICSEGVLPGLPMPWLKDVPVFVIICAKTDFFVHKFASLFSKVDYRPIDIGIAGEHFVLAAQAQGLGTCWIGWFKERNIKKIAGIPAGIKVLSLLTLGYPAEFKEQPEKKKIKEIYSSENYRS